MNTFPTTLNNYTGSETLLAAEHAQEHNALEAKVGVDGSAVTTSHDYKLSGVTGTDKAVSKTGTETLTNKTLTTPKIATLYQDSIGGSNLITFPAAADTLVGKATTDTLTNKTLTSPVINTGFSGTAKASASEVATGTEDAKIVTPKALKDAGIVAVTALSKATAAEVDAFTDDTKYVTSLTARKLTGAPASDHTVSGITIALAAHENQAFGDVCYIASDGQAQLIDADAIATMSGVVMCADASISANATGNYLLMGIARDDTWNWTVGGLIYGTVTGTTGNTLSQSAPTATDDVIQILGVATHADRMLFNPQLAQVEHT